MSFPTIGQIRTFEDVRKSLERIRGFFTAGSQDGFLSGKYQPYSDFLSALSKNKVPRFLAYNGATDDNVTGDGTDYTIGFGTEVYDIGNNYNTATHNLIAPVDGIYALGSVVIASGFTSNNTLGLIKLIAANKLYYGTRLNPYACKASDGYCAFIIPPVEAEMEHNDQAHVNLVVESTDKGVDVLGHATHLYTYFWGRLVQKY